eukprot:CAMPEP_0195301664 /NCGR_PEP_ID=MMETSP0707-20130614/29717_1 /TAXON_ID=33640 /ORGANISM="Asterionellopsis glacialis, Strain CCMP134" /LENGTH=130 /DNA_ID=CAMNT_0040364679 /DNA_START=16 /DNA_END=408 /DNA_ORIENTATION=+
MTLNSYCMVRIIEADLKTGPNKDEDWLSSPDPLVTLKHGKETRKTHVENDTYFPKFWFTSRIPYSSREGFTFTVYDYDKVGGNEVIGRCFISPERAHKLMNENNNSEPVILSVGEGIGTLKVQIEKGVDS